MKVFLSYARDDIEAARDIANRLEDEGVDVWFDEKQIAAGDNIAKRVGKELDEAHAMIVLVSPVSMKSRSVRAEIDFALTTPRFEGALIPVVLKPSVEMPWILDRMAVRAGKNRAAAVRKILETLQTNAAR